MNKFSRFVYKYRIPISGTILFHLLLLLVLSYLTVEQRRLERPEPLVSFQLEEMPEEQEQEEEEVEEPQQQPQESRSDRAVSETAPENASEASRNNFDGQSENAREQVDREIEQELQELEKEVIQEQRDAGYGYTDEEAEELINSKKMQEVEQVEEKEAESEGAVKGPTNISYKLEDRYDQYIDVPVYLCENGGEVTVNIVVDQNGKVRAAQVDEESTKTQDPCLLKAGKRAAQNTRFNRDEQAPDMQKGSITFRFVPQQN